MANGMGLTLEKENCLLKQQIAELKAQLAQPPNPVSLPAQTCNAPANQPQWPVASYDGSNADQIAQTSTVGTGTESDNPQPSWVRAHHDLTQQQIHRYSRHLILPAFGVEGQARLCKAAVLVVGAGGLGSPAALYLAAAGIGRLGIVDRDAVELSNLHRQVIHGEPDVGVHKAHSAAAACRALNSSIQVDVHLEGLTPANALELVTAFDVVVDASDNAPTRYLLSDACCCAGRPLVSGAALGSDGQLTVYHHGEDAPCYRCLFPEAPRPESCSRCCDAGVLGPVPGVIGTLQALEAVKIAAGIGSPLSRRLLLFDGLAGRFTHVKLRGRSSGCIACGDNPSITAASLASYDYTSFTGQTPSDAAPPPLQLLPPQQRLSPAALQAALRSRPDALLLDVRPPQQFAIAHLLGSFNIPYDELERRLPEVEPLCGVTSTSSTPNGHATSAEAGGELADEQRPVFVVCRRGNDSQEAVRLLERVNVRHAVDLIGGLESWRQQVDSGFPSY